MSATSTIMITLVITITILTILTYLGAAALLAFGFVQARRNLRIRGIILSALAVVGHAAVLWTALRVSGGWDLNFFNTLSLSAWAIALVLVLTSMRPGLLEAGIVVFPGAALCVALSQALPIAPLILSDPSVEMELHVFSSLLAYCLLSIAAFNALLLAVQDFLLRRPQSIRQLEMLPPLNVLEKLLFRLVAAGWAVLTVSLVTGFLFVDDLMAQHLLHKTVLTLISWVLFGLLLIGRWRYGLRGRQAVYFTLIAMFVLVLGYFGSKLVLEILLDRSWSSPEVGLSAFVQGAASIHP